ncbi:hypothetical protein D9613_003287 [Agrocybe pediades]|uniref:Uncharacterized protein n=1 Tax=Agrocybe pediades TaxID=84607 RepID=A0A8H4VM76_9AGAR|nr:hypothetical protein D9613_003287 [Agrocybe pediades]
MIWRCFHACGRSMRKLTLPLGLFVVEFLLVLTNTAFVGLTYMRKSFRNDERVHQSALISGVLETVAVATSLSATFIICQHIYSNTSQDRRSRQRYKHIVDILVQSSVLYTTSVLLGAICGFLDRGKVTSPIKAIILDNYADTVLQIMTGLAPTLMVARLVIASDTKSANTTSIYFPSELNRSAPSDDSSEFVAAAVLDSRESSDINLENESQYSV